MKANLPQKEPGLIDFWDKINLYQNLRDESKGKEKFIFMMVLHMQMATFIWELL